MAFLSYRRAAKEAIGKIDAKILFVRRFRQDGKQDPKNEHKILAITSCRVFIITRKVKGGNTVDLSFHILEIHELDSSKPMALNITLTIIEKQFQHCLLFACQEDVDKAISYMMALLKTNFVGANVERQVFVKTDSTKKLEIISDQTDLIVQSLSGDAQPCGSYALAYMCLSDLFTQIALAEVIWDVNRIYASHNIKEFRIEDFDHLETKELLPIIAALGYNTWFTKLSITSYKFTNELVDMVVTAVRKSPSLEEIVITDGHLNKDHMLRLSLAVSSNPNKVLRKIDISKNNIDDRGVSSLAGCFTTLPHGLESLCIREIGITTRGFGILVNALKTNKFIPTTLVKLDLSVNPLKSDGAQSLCDFLAQPNALETLNLTNTESALDLIFGALLRGCQQNLQNLTLSGNPFSYRKSKESQSLPAVQQFFASCRALKHADISNTKLPSEAVKAILLGLMNNPVLTDITLDLSRNELKSAGCNEIVSCIKDVRCIHTLILADNGLDQDLVQLCEALENSPCVKNLDLSGNVSKSRYNNIISEALAEMIMSETLPLETLSIANCKLKLDAAALFDCIGTNESLISINISGNGIGDVGARLIGKALQINTKLREIYMDKNGVSYRGLQDIALALERNFSLHSIPLPANDFASAFKHNPELSTKYQRQIEKALNRNQSLLESSPDQAYKVHQGLLITSIDSYTQFTDSLVVELQDLVSLHRNTTDENIRNQVKHAKSLIKETDSFRKVLLELFSDPESAKKKLHEKLTTAAGDFTNVLEGVLKINVDNMLNTARQICPNALDKEEPLGLIKQELMKEGLVDKTALQISFVQKGSADLISKLCESNLSSASIVAEELKKVLMVSLEQCIKQMSSLSVQPKAAAQPKPVSVEPVDTNSGDAQEEKAKVEETKKEEDEGKEEVPKVDELVCNKDKENDNKEQTTEVLKEVEAEEVKQEEPGEVEEEKTNNKVVEEESKEALTEKEENTEEKKDVAVPDSLPSSPIDVSLDFDMPWEFTAGNRLSVMLKDDQHGDNDSELTANKARTRLSTIAQSDARRNTGAAARKKKASIKRRPTFYRSTEKTEEIDIDISSESRSNRSSSSLSKKERYSSGDEIDASKPHKAADPDTPQARDKLLSIGGFDAVSASASHLKVNKDRAKPIQGRRAPSRVSNLAHMNNESTEKYLEEQTTHKKESPKPSPKQRPKSTTPAVKNSLETPVSPQRAASEKVKTSAKPAPTTKKPDKKGKSEKEKSKKPTGGIQLPSLSGFLKRKDRSSSKVTNPSNETETKKVSSDVVDAKPAPEPIKEEPPKPKEPVKQVEEPKEVPPKPVERPHPEAPKPEPVKRPAMIPKIGLPMAGGSALLAEMKKRQNKDGESKPSAPTPTAKPKPAPSPSRSGSVSKPPPPKRPASLKKSNEGGKPIVTDRPKPTQRPKPTEVETSEIPQHNATSDSTNEDTADTSQQEEVKITDTDDKEKVITEDKGEITTKDKEKITAADKEKIITEDKEKITTEDKEKITTEDKGEITTEDDIKKDKTSEELEASNSSDQGTEQERSITENSNIDFI